MSDQEHLDRAIEELIAGRSPRMEATHLDPEEQAMLQMAQLIRGTQPQPARRDFVDGLHDRLFPAPRRVSRRKALGAALGTLAAGILGGFGLDRAINGLSLASAPPLVAKK